MPGMSRKTIGGPLEPFEAFGQVVRSRRVDLGLSQEELGARCGLDRTYISGIERGRRNPTIQTIWKIAQGLNAPPEEVVKATRAAISEAEE